MVASFIYPRRRCVNWFVQVRLRNYNISFRFLKACHRSRNELYFYLLYLLNCLKMENIFKIFSKNVPYECIELVESCWFHHKHLIIFLPVKSFLRNDLIKWVGDVRPSVCPLTFVFCFTSVTVQERSTFTPWCDTN